MGNRWLAVVGVLVAGCSSSAGVTSHDAGGGDVAVTRDTGHEAAAQEAAADVGVEAARDTGIDIAADVPCVPMSAAQACAGKTCGFASDGCKSGFGCGPDGGAGQCPLAQACGLLAPNVCGGCTSAPDAGQLECNTMRPFDCPVVQLDGGVGPYLPPGCVFSPSRNVTCC